jgi:hypothetical protein
MSLSMFDRLDSNNAAHDYVVLRRWAELEDKSTIKDVDIMCRDVNAFALAVGATKRNWGRSSYQIVDDDILIPLDLRAINDEYVPSCLSREVLLKKRKYKNFYIPNSTHYKFLFLLHLYTHKKFISKTDFEYIERAFDITDTEGIYLYLSKIMTNQKITVFRPRDRDVYINKKNFKRLSEKNLDYFPPKVFMLRVKMRSLFDGISTKG